MSDDSIYREIREAIDARIASGEVITRDSLTHDIVRGKSKIEGEDIEFYRVCAFKFVADLVRKCIGKFDARPETDPQLVLDGFEHLQKAYTVQRGGQTVLVPIDQLTDIEIELRAQDYEKMAKGCLAHSRELRSYKRNRTTGEAA